MILIRGICFQSRSSSPGDPSGTRDDDDDDDENAYNNGHYRNDRNSRSHHGSRVPSRRSKSRSIRRSLMAGCELVSSDDELNQDDNDDEGDVAVLGFGSKGPSGSRVARLEEARCEAVRSQCAVITLLLHRHARLTSEVASALVDDQEILGGPGSGPGSGFPYSARSTALLHDAGQHLGLSKKALQHVAFWLKGRLVQVVLEVSVDVHCRVYCEHPWMWLIFPVNVVCN